jgi:glycogen phosphorylase
LTVDEVARLRATGYDPRAASGADRRLATAIDAVASGMFSRGDTNLFRPLVDNLLEADPFLVLADFSAYADCQVRVDEAFKDVERWTRMSMLNTARVGWFSSDRSIREYCEKIWEVAPLRVTL